MADCDDAPITTGAAQNTLDQVPLTVASEASTECAKPTPRLMCELEIGAFAVYYYYQYVKLPPELLFPERLTLQVCGAIQLILDAGSYYPNASTRILNQLLEQIKAALENFLESPFDFKTNLTANRRLRIADLRLLWHKSLDGGTMDLYEPVCFKKVMSCPFGCRLFAESRGFDGYSYYFATSDDTVPDDPSYPAVYEDHEFNPDDVKNYQEAWANADHFLHTMPATYSKRAATPAPEVPPPNTTMPVTLSERTATPAPAVPPPNTSNHDPVVIPNEHVVCRPAHMREVCLAFGAWVLDSHNHKVSLAVSDDFLRDAFCNLCTSSNISGDVITFYELPKKPGSKLLLSIGYDDDDEPPIPEPLIPDDAPIEDRLMASICPLMLTLNDDGTQSRAVKSMLKKVRSSKLFQQKIDRLKRLLELAAQEWFTYDPSACSRVQDYYLSNLKRFGLGGLFLVLDRPYNMTVFTFTVPLLPQCKSPIEGYPTVIPKEHQFCDEIFEDSEDEDEDTTYSSSPTSNQRKRGSKKSKPQKTGKAPRRKLASRARSTPY